MPGFRDIRTRRALIYTGQQVSGNRAQHCYVLLICRRIGIRHPKQRNTAPPESCSRLAPLSAAHGGRVFRRLRQLSFFVFLISASALASPLLLHNPSLSKDKIAFRYADDVWIVSRDGGEAQRLTCTGSPPA